jgi:hypothetical protein
LIVKPAQLVDPSDAAYRWPPRGVLRRDFLAGLGLPQGAPHTNAVNIYVWKNGRQASILFTPSKPHPESGSVEHLKAVAGRVYGKM